MKHALKFQIETKYIYASVVCNDTYPLLANIAAELGLSLIASVKRAIAASHSPWKRVKRGGEMIKGTSI